MQKNRQKPKVLRSKRDVETWQAKASTGQSRKPTRKAPIREKKKKEPNSFQWTLSVIFIVVFTGVLIYALTRNKRPEHKQSKEKSYAFEQSNIPAVQKNTEILPRVVSLKKYKPETNKKTISSNDEWDEFFKSDINSPEQAELPAFLFPSRKKKESLRTDKENKKDKFEVLVAELAGKLLANEIEDTSKSIKDALQNEKMKKGWRQKLEKLSYALKKVLQADEIIIASFEAHLGNAETIETLQGSKKVKILNCVPAKGYLKVEFKDGNTVLSKKITTDQLLFTYKLKILKNSGKMDNFALSFYRTSAALENRKYSKAFELLLEMEHPVTLEMLKQLEAYHKKAEHRLAQKTFQWLLQRRKIKSGDEDLLRIRKGLARKRFTDKQIDAVINMLRDHYAAVALKNYFTKADILQKGEMTRTQYKKIRDMAENYKNAYIETDFYRNKGKGLLVAFLKDGLSSYHEKFRNVRKIDFLDLILIPIEAGEFTMKNAVSEKRKVNISKPFWMGKYEITQNQYNIIMGNNPSIFKKKKGKLKYPVENVSWDDAMEFCRRLTEIEKKQKKVPENYEFRLPTSAEWEYCCRAGTTGKYSFENIESELFKYGNYCDKSNSNKLLYQDKYHNDGFDKTSPVGSFLANPWNIYDMHGNVWEWCFDWDGKIGPDEENDPAGAAFGTSKLIRGGAWDEEAYRCRSLSTSFESPSAQFDNLGFRIVMAPVLNKEKKF